MGSLPLSISHKLQKIKEESGGGVWRKKEKKAFPFTHPMFENSENTQPILIIWFYCTGKLIIIIH